MPTYDQVLMSCNLHNLIERRVNETNHASLRRYWEAAANRNFAITLGASPDLRERALIAALRELRRRRRGPIVVLSSSESLENQIRAAMGANGLGRIWVPTPTAEYGYALFSGMGQMKIHEILLAICQQRAPFAVGEMTAYTDAFLELLARNNSLQLSEMLRWADRTDEELAWAAKRIGMSVHHQDSIRTNTAGGNNLRTFLRLLRDAFAGISTPACRTQASITMLARENALIFVRDTSLFPDIFRLALMKELEAVIGNGVTLTLVLDGVEPTANNYVRELMLYALQHRNVRLGLCGRNLWSSLQPNAEQILGAISSWIVFNPGGEQVDVEAFLGRFGVYSYHYPVFAGGNENLLSANYTEAVEQRARVRTQDLTAHHALLAGHLNGYLELCGWLE